MGAFLRCWIRLSQLPWWTRWPVKWVVLVAVLVVVLFPNPLLLARQIRIYGEADRLIDPDAKSLADMKDDFERIVPPTLPAAEQLLGVEIFVHDRIRYAFDWEIWSVVDYWPTVDEALSRGSEDCDGRAIVAASLLADRGFSPRLATDLVHVWVETDVGSCMGPGKSTVMRTDGTGNAIYNTPSLLQSFRALSFGISVFPLWRELVLLFTGALLIYDPRGGRTGFLALSGIAMLGLLGLWAGGGLNHRVSLSAAGGIGMAAALLGLWAWPLVRNRKSPFRIEMRTRRSRTSLNTSESR
jgi:hypothetical protein